MKRINILIFVLISIVSFSMASVPKKVTSAGKAVGSVTTYNASGKAIGTVVAFAAGDGDVYAELSPFNGASKAEITLPGASKRNVTRVKGASGIYDVIKLLADSKGGSELSATKSGVEVGKAVYVIKAEPDGKKSQAIAAKVRKKDNVSGGTYYELSCVYDAGSVGCPVVDENGEWVGIVQRNVKDDKSTYAIGADFCQKLAVTEMDYADPTLSSVNIPKLLPSGEKEAYTYIYMMGQVVHSGSLLQTAIEDFIKTYPNNPDGYIELAKSYASGGRYAECEESMNKAVSVAEKKDNPHYAFSKIIYQNVLKHYSETSATGWSLEKALNEAQAAYSINPLPAYQLQMGDCYFGMKKYAEAASMYSSVNHSSLSSPETFYYEAVARSKTDSLDGAVVVLLDSAIGRFHKPYSDADSRRVAPYYLARGNQLSIMGKYRESTLDYIEYEHLVGYANLNDNFYYRREQVALKGNMYQQALDDINRALALRADDYVYNAEKAALMLRLGMFDDAIRCAKRAIGIDANVPDGYRLLGIAYGELKQKQLCMQNLKKAKALGDAHADELISQYK